MSLQPLDEAVWQGDTGLMVALPQADPATWPGSIQADCRAFGPDTSLPIPAAPGPATREVAVVMMLKNEGDIIGHNLDWLYYTGVRRYVVLDNGSSDDSRGAMLAFRHRHNDAELVIMDDPRISYAQGLKTTGLMRLAVSLWPDATWTFAIDADEFLIPSLGYGPLLEISAVFDAITIPKVIHHRMRGVEQEDKACPMRLMPLRSRPFKLPAKVACRSHVHRGVSDGNHRAVLLDGRIPLYHGGLALGLYIREFQNRSYEQFRRKIMNGAPAVLAARAEGSFGGGDHWITYYNVLEAHGPDGLREYFNQHSTLEPGPDAMFDPFTGSFNAATDGHEPFDAPLFDTGRLK